MDAIQIIAYIMLAAPFVGLFVWAWGQAGFWAAVAIYSSLALLFGWIQAGLYLLEVNT